MTKPQTLKGFRDFLPKEKNKRDWLIKKIVNVFELFGFEPLETPTLEYTELLLGKYGKEADKLVYSFTDRGGRNIALRYDQTVPTARILAQYKHKLPKYFRRYQIQNVFRADKPQKGRFREFTQCDIDIFNSTSSIADAEIIACTYFAFKAIGYPTIVVKVNDRKVLFDALSSFVTKKVNVFSIIQSIDKLDKTPVETVVMELIKKGLSKQQAQSALQSIQSAQMSKNIKTTIDQVHQLGVPKKSLKFEPILARGLDYYTGIIFEITVPEYPVGSLAGGGRYNNLIKDLSGIDIPAVGIAFGFDRMVEAATELKLISQENTGTQVLVTIFDKSTQKKSLTTAQLLRQSNIKTEIYPALDKIDKQLKYANRNNIPFVIIIGPDEIKNNIATVKNMKQGKQETISIDELVDLLKN